MRFRRPRSRAGSSLLPLTAATVTAAVLVGTSAPAPVFLAQGSSGSRAARGANEFGLRVGSVTGLRPGGDVTVPVRYANPFPHDLAIRSQQIEVTSPTRACAATYVDLTSARSTLGKPLVVPARRVRTVKVVLSLRVTAPDGCQGVRFETTVRAQGRRP